MHTQQIIHIESEIDSTLNYIKELDRESHLEEGFTVYADFQKAGRGQRGNSWESAPKLNLMFSTILYPNQIKATKQFIISQIVSLAILDILGSETNNISIKWPNDIYWNDKKLAGILIENEIMGDSIARTVLGIGININQEKFESDAPNPISLKQITGKDYNIEDILKDILNRILFYYKDIYDKDGEEKIRKAYKNSLFRKEGSHKFTDMKSTFSAKIENVEDSGLLVLKTEKGEIKKYAFKEIKYVL